MRTSQKHEVLLTIEERELLIKKGIDIEKGLKEIEEETKVVMKMGNAPVV